MRFKTDENLPMEIAELLARAGHDVLRVDQQGLKGVADPGLAAVCQVEQRAIVTLDTDFMDIRRYAPASYAGIIVLRPHRQAVPHLVRLTTRLIMALDSEQLVGKLWIVDEGRIRIRPDEIRD
jgi:predicted nuclease of predicted toxin-antitoxin system